MERKSDGMAKADLDDEMYKLVCKERFDKLDYKMDEVLRLLQGDNGNIGLCEKVRVLSGRWKIILGGFILIISAFITQIIRWLFE